MNRPLHRCLALTVVAGALIVLAGLSQAQNAPPPGLPAVEKASGEIVTAGIPAQDAESSRKVRSKRQNPHLKINTAVPWRDWVRDQIARAQAGQDAEMADGPSVAPLGQPRTPGNLLEIVVMPRTRVELRNRPGVEENPEAENPAQGTAANRSPRKKRGPAASKKTWPLHTNSLKPNLFVEVEYRSAEGENRASKITIFRPTGIALPPQMMTPPQEEEEQQQLQLEE